jgi:hypothetical protein
VHAGLLSVRSIASLPLNIGPNLLYFSIDDRVAAA